MAFARQTNVCCCSQTSLARPRRAQRFSTPEKRAEVTASGPLCPIVGAFSLDDCERSKAKTLMWRFAMNSG